MTNDNKPHFVDKVLLRQPIGSVRMVIALFTIGATVTKLLYNRFLPELTDFDTVRWTIIVLGCVFFATTYIRIKRGLIVTYFSFFLYLATLLYVMAFVVINRFDPHAVIILILVTGASTVVMNSLFYYGLQCTLILLITLVTFLSGGFDSGQIISMINLTLAMVVFGIVVSIRLKLIESIKESYNNLDKLNVMSIVANKAGEIVFVSPSVRKLLGYDPSELIQEGWWEENNLQEGWINRDYIVNYPNIMPKELASVETVVRSKDGKTVWLNWANSLLPNGNYVGVALDITRYKMQA
ncbi:MAG: PAS domain S-box protein [Flammeovirgaceae bacterium]|nr:MAG: PAS domain S-box protein [Flammeovirgaceae bacterium]